MNAYEVLNVPATATPQEIRAAYRDLARRWHPDRFMAGPERDWANEKMAAINAAYRACLDGAREAGGEQATLKRVQALIDGGKYQSARKLLMGLDTRCAEWNYLFGWLLMHNDEVNKALIYLSVAAHQKPECVKYAKALEKAQSMSVSASRLSRLLARMRI
jgi:hypothetical protein